MVFDAHFHIIDPRFPLVPNQDFLPNEFTVADYWSAVDDLEIKGGAVVSGSFQAFDQGYLIDALQQLGENFVGVTQIPASTTDEQIIELNKAGVRAVRFNLKRGGSESIDQLESLAKRVYDLVKWHVELYVDSSHLPEISDTLIKLPAYSIDHLGLSEEGLPYLLALVEKGARVKATGFGRVDLDIKNAMAEINKINPAALMFGTDLPGTRARHPFTLQDIDLMVELFTPDEIDRILWDNAAEFYQIGI